MYLHQASAAADGGGGKKHEIYVAAFDGHLFYDLFVQGLGGPWLPQHPLDPLLYTGREQLIWAQLIRSSI